VERAYDLGANTYFVKPSTFDQLLTLVRTLHDYWELGMKPKRNRAA
jgi:hypothetical protein